MNIRPVAVIEPQTWPLAPSQSRAGLSALLAAAERRVVLTGAGCSTESGIPDYRGPDGVWRTRRPVMYGDFVRDESVRRYYWARSFRGWDRFRAARPNAAHDALARLEGAGGVATLITQNVDGLHQAAGSERVIELHGSNHRVVCLDCREGALRADFQARLAEANRGWTHEAVALRADGDAEIDRELTAGFRVAGCERCGGVVKPDVVFFGECVPRPRVEEAMNAVANADVLFVVGSSLAIWSGFRFAREAAARGVPIAILNRGWTRADDLATARLDARCGEALPGIVDEITE